MISILQEDELKETLANYAHEAWSGWMDYLFSRSQRNFDGSVVIPTDLVSRWRYQVGTKYADLPEEMKESDRKEANVILATILKYIEKRKEE